MPSQTSTKSQNQDKSITKWFAENLAQLLGQKIQSVYPDFDLQKYIQIIKSQCQDLSYTKRIELHAEILHELLPSRYDEAIGLLVDILGPENPNQTGMFTNFYWIMPIGKFVEKYGLGDFDISIKAIEEITKRNTGEYAIRPYIRKCPDRTMQIMLDWSKSNNFHLRRLASEGCRPKLPWATKLDNFIKTPKPVFEILENLMQDEIKFVQKSVANNLADYLKVNPDVAWNFIAKYENSDNKNTQWILKHATRRVRNQKNMFRQPDS